MKTASDARFKIHEFTNPRTGTLSFRVAGIKRDGTRIRENYQDKERAQVRQIELEVEWLGRQSTPAIRATELTDIQIKLAEAAFARLDADEEITSAVDAWIRQGRAQAVKHSVRLDEAADQFLAWLDTTEELRPKTKGHLRSCIGLFRNSIGNVVVSHLTPEAVEQYLERRQVCNNTKNADRRCISRFFTWCLARPRRWMASNPAREVKVTRTENGAPAILTVEQCEKLLRTAETFQDGKLVPYLAVTMFAGLRPTEAQRLSWQQVNLGDAELRLEGNQTKTGKPRVVTIHPTLKAWLSAYQGRPFSTKNHEKQFQVMRGAAGIGKWVPDVLRHTAISFYFRQTGSYGLTAEQFGNSEAIIKAHYQGRVSSEDTKRFYAILPK